MGTALVPFSLLLIVRIKIFFNKNKYECLNFQDSSRVIRLNNNNV